MIVIEISIISIFGTVRTKIRIMRFFLSILLYFIISLSFSLSAQQKSRNITLEKIFVQREFSPETIRGIRSMNDGEHYTTLTGGSAIVRHLYRSGERVDTVFSLDMTSSASIKSIDDYTFSPDEKRIMLTSNTKSIYRYSYTADHYIWNIDQKEISPLSENGSQQVPSFCNHGSRIAFVRDNNIFIKCLDNGAEIQVTRDGDKNRIINGIPDWVYEEEFAFSKAYEWSPDGKRIAYYRFDESRVRQFKITYYGDLYPRLYQYKYPKAGEQNSRVSIHIYDIDTGETIEVDTGDETDQYIPRIKWTRDPGVLSVFRLNRQQNHLELLLADAATGSSRVIQEERDKCYISEVDNDKIHFLKDGKHYIYMSEESGYMHFYLHSMDGKRMRQITRGHFDIEELLGIDHAGEKLYYTSNENSTVQTDVFSISFNGKRKKQLSDRPGCNHAAFSKGFKYYINVHSDANTPPFLTLNEQSGEQIRVLEDNAELKSKMEDYGFGKKELFTITTTEDVKLNAYMIKPQNFDPDRIYPLFMFVYGGPESQSVRDRYGHRMPWYQLLLQEGYIVACVDNRGTDGKGEAFRKSTYMQLGKLETTDQVGAAVYFGGLPFIDRDRIGIFGWSYGGFLTALCMTKGAGTFRMGIAVAPVTNWRYYDTIYTERFMRTPGENPEGYDNNSPINHAGKLEGRFLLIHGMADDNVHLQHSAEFSEALIQSGKSFDMQFYPNKNHGIYGGNTTLHLYSAITRFIKENL